MSESTKRFDELPNAILFVSADDKHVVLPDPAGPVWLKIAADKAVCMDPCGNPSVKEGDEVVMLPSSPVWDYDDDAEYLRCGSEPVFHAEVPDQSGGRALTYGVGMRVRRVDAPAVGTCVELRVGPAAVLINVDEVMFVIAAMRKVAKGV